jgi:uncharacterized protein with HEPN domain
MPGNPRPALRTIVESAAVVREFTRGIDAEKIWSMPFKTTAVLIQLKRLADAVDRLAPPVKAMRPDAPWLDVGWLRYLDPLDHVPYHPRTMADVMNDEVRTLGQAAAEIIAELDARGLTAPAATVAPPAVYQIKVTLADLEPPIWRRLLISNRVTLRRLHMAIQMAGGWWNYHLHLFQIAGTEYGYPDPEGSIQLRSDAHVTLATLPLGQGSRFVYEYDFGDDWVMDLVLEDVLSPADAPAYPVCLGGERAFPHEDCGGVPGYRRMVRILRHPRHPEYEEMRTWAGDHYDPERFDLDFVNAQLRTGKHRPVL